MHPRLEKIIANNVEYKHFPVQFLFLTIWGIWFPLSWSTKYRILNRVIFTVVFFLDSISSLEMIIYFLISFNTDDKNLLNFFYVIAITSAVYKAIQLVRQREMIREFIVGHFKSTWFDVQDEVEEDLYKSTDTKIRFMTIAYALSMSSIVLLKASFPIFQNTGGVPLPVKGWYPYSVEGLNIWFWMTYLQQCLLGMSTVTAHVAIDTLFIGMLLKTSFEIKVLGHRLQKLSQPYKEITDVNRISQIQKRKIVKIVQEHERILIFGKELNIKFQELLVIVVISSIPNICINIYSLAVFKGNIDIEYVSVFSSTTTSFLQLYFICWYGNQVSIHSAQLSDAIFESNWTGNEKSIKQLLTIIMIRASRAIEFSVGYVIPMNVDSFLKVLKTSYTVFNLLSTTMD